MASLTSITRYKLRKVLKYMLVTLLAAWVLTLFSGDAVRGNLFAWALLGLWTGVLEEFLFGRRYRSLAIPLQFLGKVLAVNALTIALVALAFAFDRQQNLPLRSEGTFSAAEMLGMAQFYQLILRVVVVSSIAILVVQVEEIMGRRMFLGVLLGRYERPIAEERIVLTMDLVGSTTLAERMGDLRYFRFLNMTYSLMTDAVLRNEAEIHKYVGDEVIFTWTMSDGIRTQNCLDLCFDIAERIQAHAPDFEREFGVVPQFRGAVHGGRVIVAQIGHIKRAVDFNGDVMNSVSRMLGVGKDLKTPLIISSELYGRIPGLTDRFSFGPEQTVPVKGRKREVRVRTVERLRPSLP
jgi:adenylate cyclase